MMGPVTDAPSKGLVLVVEDERPIADLLRLYLTREGFGVQVEHDGTAGLAAARRLRPVLCILAGATLARFIARPVRQAAAAAARLSAGDRSVRLVARPPEETAELAVAFNELAEALRTSEGRERDFLLSVSHELRTPLSTIRGYAEALAD